MPNIEEQMQKALLGYADYFRVDASNLFWSPFGEDPKEYRHLGRRAMAQQIRLLPGNYRDLESGQVWQLYYKIPPKPQQETPENVDTNRDNEPTIPVEPMAPTRTGTTAE